MTQNINPARLKLARTRKQLTLKALAEKVGLTARMVSEYEKDYCKSIPPDSTIQAFANALSYPKEFFFCDSEIEIVEPESVSFRSMKSMRAAQQHAAIGAGTLGLMLNDYFDHRFNLPKIDIPDLRSSTAEVAAEELRELWGLGSQSISNMVHLLEKHGIRVFSLAENTQAVDAFSFWKDEKAFVFLNTQKSGERSRMDVAHELGHLVLHKHGIPKGKDIEAEADRFAAFFLMPRDSVLACSSSYLTLEDVMKLRDNWKTSAMAVIMQLRAVGAISEWHHRTLIIEASKRGLRRTEIDGIDREKTLLLKILIDSLETNGVYLKDIAKELMLPLSEISNLVFQVGTVPLSEISLELSEPRRPNLRVV